jgi:predicted DNA-binding protein (UPF0251 family)
MRISSALFPKGRVSFTLRRRPAFADQFSDNRSSRLATTSYARFWRKTRIIRFWRTARKRIRKAVRSECPSGRPYREILVLRDIEELDTETTAQLLGINPGAVKTRLHRARQALRTLLEPFVLGEAREPAPA